MTRNTNEWFKFFHRAWLESESVFNMSLPAQALYIRALSAQAIHHSLPTDKATLALYMKVLPKYLKYWPEVEPHFETEEVSGQPRLFNRKLRDQLSESIAKRSAHRKGAEITNAKRYAERGENTSLSDTLSASPRASYSLSSVSKLLDNIDKVPYSHLGEQYAKARSEQTGVRFLQKSVLTYAKMIAGMIEAGEATEDQVESVIRFLASPEGKGEWAFGLGSVSTSYTHAFRRNFAGLLMKATLPATNHRNGRHTGSDKDPLEFFNPSAEI